MIRYEVFRQLTKFTYVLERKKQDDHIKGIQTIDPFHVPSRDGERR